MTNNNSQFDTSNVCLIPTDTTYLKHQRDDKKPTVVVGLSGGVDSSVAAALLLEQGYNVIGLFMKNWDDTDDVTGECTSAQDYRDVVHVCGILNIPHYTVNFTKKYMDEVFEYFLKTLKKGNTPNPDVLCNREIKFGAFYDFCFEKLDADFVATGHYAKTDGVHLLRPKDSNKDQTYFLHQVGTEKFSKTLFPLADLDKSDVRAIAQKYGFSTASKKDSTGICFIGEKNFKEFIHQFIPQCDGDIVDTQGNKVGRHTGVHGYTIGQRRGLGIGGKKGGSGSWVVCSKDIKNNLLIAKQGDESVLDSKSCKVEEINFIGKQFLKIGQTVNCTAKFRYRQYDTNVQVTRYDDHLQVEFETPQRAVTIGQYAVFYDGERCLGGGEIISVEMRD